ncbi:hypothetical protein Tco_1174636 [Tanacetum coccineum]
MRFGEGVVIFCLRVHFSPIAYSLSHGSLKGAYGCILGHVQRGLLTDLRLSDEDSFFGDCILGVIYVMFWIIRHDVVALCFNAFSILYTDALCYDDQFLYHTLCFRLSQGVTPEPQPQPLPHCPSLDVSLGNERGSKQPIKPHSLDSFRMKAIDPLTIHTPPLPHVASFHLRDLYCYYHPFIDSPKKHYGFKPGLLGHSGSLGVDFLKLEMIENDSELEIKEVSFLGRGLNLPVRPKEVEKVRIKDSHHLEHIFQQVFQHMAPLHHNGTEVMTGSVISTMKGPDTLLLEDSCVLGFICLTMPKPEGLHKGYDMFQSLLSQLEIHGADVSTEDAN